MLERESGLSRNPCVRSPRARVERGPPACHRMKRAVRLHFTAQQL